MKGSPFGNLGNLRPGPEGRLRWALPSSREMQDLDAATIADGVSSLELMQRAGGNIAKRILAAIPTAQRFLVLCGPGNNGGDGLVISEILRDAGRSVEVIVASAESYSPECQEQMRRSSGFSVFVGDSESSHGVVAQRPRIEKGDLLTSLQRAHVVVDAMLGTGQRAAPRGAIGTIVEIISATAEAGVTPLIFSVDLPTGVDADTGGIFEPHIVAHTTFAIECCKRGMLQFPARTACGDIEVVPIGIAAHSPVEFFAVEDEWIPRLNPRPPDIHKGQLGRVLVLGGSTLMPGAAMLAAHGALRAGAGTVSRLVKRAWVSCVGIPECMNALLAGSEDYFTSRDVERTLQLAASCDALVLGPGLGAHDETADFVEGVIEGLRMTDKRVVIDADALTIVAQRAVSLQSIRAILTPHPGEAGRLLGEDSDIIQRERFSAVRRLAERYGQVVVLKGAGTLVFSGFEGRMIIRGTPYLATPGSGDVLSGIVAACVCRATTLFDAACLGVWLHACSGMRASENSGGVIAASDIATSVSAVIGAWEL